MVPILWRLSAALRLTLTLPLLKASVPSLVTPPPSAPGTYHPHWEHQGRTLSLRSCPRACHLLRHFPLPLSATSSSSSEVARPSPSWAWFWAAGRWWTVPWPGSGHSSSAAHWRPVRSVKVGHHRESPSPSPQVGVGRASLGQEAPVRRAPASLLEASPMMLPSQGSRA